jgi:thiosulfate dehydrogenase (quinone) large subunit
VIADRLPQATTALWPVAVARIMMGLLWLYSLRWKLPPDFDGGSERGLREWLDLEVEHAAFGVYGRVIEDLVLPNFTFFAWCVFLAELVVGAMLLVGLATRAAAVAGLVMSINLGIGLLDVPGEWPWSYVMMAMWHGAIFLAAAGRMWGVDGWLEARRTNDGQEGRQ